MQEALGAHPPQAGDVRGKPSHMPATTPLTTPRRALVGGVVVSHLQLGFNRWMQPGPSMTSLPDVVYRAEAGVGGRGLLLGTALSCGSYGGQYKLAYGV